MKVKYSTLNADERRVFAAAYANYLISHGRVAGTSKIFDLAMAATLEFRADLARHEVQTPPTRKRLPEDLSSALRVVVNAFSHDPELSVFERELDHQTLRNKIGGRRERCDEVMRAAIDLGVLHVRVARGKGRVYRLGDSYQAIAGT